MEQISSDSVPRESDRTGPHPAAHSGKMLCVRVWYWREILYLRFNLTHKGSLFFFQIGRSYKNSEQQVLRNRAGEQFPFRISSAVRARAENWVPVKKKMILRCLANWGSTLMTLWMQKQTQKVALLTSQKQDLLTHEWACNIWFQANSLKPQLLTVRWALRIRAQVND